MKIQQLHNKPKHYRKIVVSGCTYYWTTNRSTFCHVRNAETGKCQDTTRYWVDVLGYDINSDYEELHITPKDVADSITWAGI